MAEKSSSSASANLSVQKKRSARLAAVQYLYEWKLNDNTPPPLESYIAAYSQRILDGDMDNADESSDNPLPAPDFAFLRKLVTGLSEEYIATRRFLNDRMEQGRGLERTSPLIQSLLEAGSYELIHHESLKPSIILSEYTAIAAGFFDNPELAFVNGTLQEVANYLRPQN